MSMVLNLFKIPRFLASSLTASHCCHQASHRCMHQASLLCTGMPKETAMSDGACQHFGLMGWDILPTIVDQPPRQHPIYSCLLWLFMPIKLWKSPTNTLRLCSSRLPDPPHTFLQRFALLHHAHLDPMKLQRLDNALTPCGDVQDL